MELLDIKPKESLRDVIKNNNPKYMIIANSFGVRGIGHFKEYIVQEEIVDCKKIKKSV